MTIEKIVPSEFKNLQGIEYFDFEEDFMEDNIRCIPMIVRFKMDIAGIKLKLAEWSRFPSPERVKLALLPASTHLETSIYRMFLCALIEKYTDNQPTLLAIELHPAWENLRQIPAILEEKSKEINLSILLNQWQNLSAIQRFALLKLCRAGHENENFPKAAIEFGLLKH